MALEKMEEKEETNSNEGDESNNSSMGSACCKVDSDHMFGLVGIVATVLNLLVVVFIYLYTPV